MARPVERRLRATGAARISDAAKAPDAATGETVEMGNTTARRRRRASDPYSAYSSPPAAHGAARNCAAGRCALVRTAGRRADATPYATAGARRPRPALRPRRTAGTPDPGSPSAGRPGARTAPARGPYM